MSHVKITKGARLGHVFRRCVHLSCILTITFTYYYLLPFFAAYHHYVIIAIIIPLALFEFTRIKFNWLFWGMREFESSRVCSAAWSVFGLAFLFFFAPDSSYVYPIALLSAFIDPLSGELKHKMPKWLLILLLSLVSILIWYFVAYGYFAWPMWYGFVVCAVAILMDFLPWNAIDDNITMLVCPFLTLCLLAYIFK